MHSFYQGCADAGKEGCAFWAPTAENIRANLTRLYDTLKEEPLSARLSDGRFAIVSHDSLRLAVFASLYRPFSLFSRMAEVLADLANGNANTLFSFAPTPSFRCGRPGEEIDAFESVEDGEMAIHCTDGDAVEGGLKEMLRHYEHLSKESEWGPYWSSLRIGCAFVCFLSR